MHPLDKKRKMKERFEKRKQTKSFHDNELKLIKGLDLHFEIETIELYSTREEGGARCD